MNQFDLPASKDISKPILSKKEKEKEILDHFMLRFQYTNYSVDISDESPDLSILCNGVTIGCEVTEFYNDIGRKGSKSRKYLATWQKFAMELKGRLDQKGIYLYGAIHFLEPSYDTSIINDKNFLTEIEAICESQQSLSDRHFKIAGLPIAKYPIVTQSVESIYFRPMDAQSKYLWWPGHFQSGFIDFSNQETLLRQIVAQKCLSAKHYKENFIQKWLLIYAEGNGLNDLCPYHAIESLTILKPTYFTHIFVFDRWNEEIYSLFPKNKLIVDSDKEEIHINYLPITI